jgi:hypothetical protein
VALCRKQVFKAQFPLPPSVNKSTLEYLDSYFVKTLLYTQLGAVDAIFSIQAMLRRLEYVSNNFGLIIYFSLIATVWVILLIAERSARINHYGILS